MKKKKQKKNCRSIRINNKNNFDICMVSAAKICFCFFFDNMPVVPCVGYRVDLLSLLALRSHGILRATGSFLLYIFAIYWCNYSSNI